MIRNEVRAGTGFRVLETYGVYQKFSNQEGKIEYLEQQLAYKDQKIEFLKKLYL